jgi:hypothetical protein
LASNDAADTLYADSSERETINFMTEGIARIPQIAHPSLWERLADPSSVTRMRNFASFIAQEETFLVRYGMQEGTRPFVEQKVLCISKNSEEEAPSTQGIWTDYFGQLSGLG